MANGTKTEILKSLNSMRSTFFISPALPYHHISKIGRDHKNIKPMSRPIILVISVLRYLVTSVNYNLMLLWSPRVTIIKWKWSLWSGQLWVLNEILEEVPPRTAAKERTWQPVSVQLQILSILDSSFPFLSKTFKNLSCVSRWVRITCLSVFGI